MERNVLDNREGVRAYLGIEPGANVPRKTYPSGGQRATAFGTWLGHVAFVGLLATAGCTGYAIDENGSPCDDGKCHGGYVCNPVSNTCAVPTSVACDGENPSSVCPDEVATGNACTFEGSFIPCSSEHTDCSAGCRTCEGGSWSACTCAPGNNCLCGNGVVDASEVCDDGELNSDDWSLAGHCRSDCSGLAPTCGDGTLDTEFEVCDDGANNQDGWAAAEHCNATCSGFGPFCGDGVVTAQHETCEDDCPTSCETIDPCTPILLTGDADHCNLACTPTPVTACVDDDACCAPGCTWWGDNNCAPLAAFSGVTEDLDTVPPSPLAGVTLSVLDVTWDANRDGSTNGDDAEFLTASATPGDGTYQITGTIPDGTTITVQAQVEQSTGDDGLTFDVPDSVVTRSVHHASVWQEVSLNIPVARFSWLARIAVDCGLYGNFLEAAGNGAMNPKFLNTSAIVGFLRDAEDLPVSGVPKYAITVELDDNLGDASPGFINSALEQVCFLEESAGALVGSTRETSSETGAFVVFHATTSPSADQGSGTATVRVVDYGVGVEFTPVTISLLASHIGVVRLQTQNDPRRLAPPVDFDDDIIPIFAAANCLGCHRNSDTQGFAFRVVRPDAEDSSVPLKAIWGAVTDVEPPNEPDAPISSDEVYYNLTGPGRFCGTDGCPADDSSHPVNQGIQNVENYLENTYPRVCVDSVECSLLVVRPQRLFGVHLGVFLDEIDPTKAEYLRTLRAWVAQGARRRATVSFEQDVLPIFARRGCTAGCHDSGSPGGDIVRGGRPATLVGAAAEVRDNLILPGTGTTCHGEADDGASYPRVCTDEPMRSLLVRRMIDNHQSSTPGPFTPPSLQAVTEPWDLGPVLLWLSQGTPL